MKALLADSRNPQHVIGAVQALTSFSMFSKITICPKTITLQEFFLGAVILTGDLNDFRTELSDDLGHWES